MFAWVREHTIRRRSPAVERAEAAHHELEQLVERRQQEASETVRQERVRRERLTGAFILDAMRGDDPHRALSREERQP